MRKIFASMTAVSMAAAVMLAGCGSNSSDKKTTTAASTKATEAATEKKTEAATEKKTEAVTEKETEKVYWGFVQGIERRTGELQLALNKAHA